MPANPYNIHMALQTLVAAHISTLHAALAAHIQEDPFSEFQDVLVCAHRLLWSLPVILPWHEFKLRYHDFVITGDPGHDA